MLCISTHVKSTFSATLSFSVEQGDEFPKTDSCNLVNFACTKIQKNKAGNNSGPLVP